MSSFRLRRLRSNLDEVIAVTIVHDHAARLRSYELLAEIAAANEKSGVPRFATAGS